jgi:hypothetical protein
MLPTSSARNGGLLRGDMVSSANIPALWARFGLFIEP